MSHITNNNVKSSLEPIPFNQGALEILDTSATCTDSIPLCYEQFVGGCFGWQGDEKVVPDDMVWQSQLPISDMVDDYMRLSLPLLEEEAPQIYAVLAEMEVADYEDALQTWILGMSSLKKGNPTRLITFSERCLKTLATIKKPNEFIESTKVNLSLIIQMLSSSHVHLMKESVASLFQQPVPQSSDVIFHIAVSSYAHFASSMLDLSILTAQLYKQLNEEKKVRFPEDEISCIFSDMARLSAQLKIEFFEENPDFPTTYKIDIFRLHNDLQIELEKQNEGLLKNVLKILADNYSIKTLSIIYNGGEFQNCNPIYVKNHCETYQDFLPHIQENREYLLERTFHLDQLCEVLNNFNLYLKFGNLNALQDRLKEKCTCGYFRSVIIEEILKFSAQKISDPVLLRKVIGFLMTKKGEILRKSQCILGMVQRFYSRMHLNLDVVLEKSLRFAQQNSIHLISFIENVVPQMTAKKKRAIGSSLMNGPRQRNKNEGPCQTAPRSTPSSSTTLSSPKAEPKSLPQLLSSLQGNSRSHFEVLQKHCHGFETTHALKDALWHFNALICAVNRFSRNSKNPMERAELFSFVSGYVLHGNLMVEQMLSALYRQSNSASCREDLTPHLSHNLVDILFGCKFTDTHLSPEVRQWISSINRGEVSTRAVALCPLGGNFIQRLLVKTWLYSTGNDAFNLEDIAEDIASYTKNLGAFCFSFATPFHHTKKGTLKENLQSLEAVRLEMNDLRAKLKELIRALKIENGTSASDPRSDVLLMADQIRSQVIPFYESAPSQGIKASFNNILSNLLVRLESELQTSGHVHPAEASQHYSNILLLNQMIAEQFLQNQIDAGKVDAKIAPHDLLAMVQALGMNESQFSAAELNFLSRGKETLSLCRYSSSYFSLHRSVPVKKMHHIEVVLKDTEKLRAHTLTDCLIEGFTYEEKTGKILSAVDLCVKEDVFLLLSILKKISKISA